MPFFKKLSDILLRPSSFFNKIKKEGYKEPILFQLILYLVTTVLSLPALILLFLTNPQFSQISFPNIGILITIILVPILIIVMFAFVIAYHFIGAGILHIFVILFGGKDYLKTFKAQTYGHIPRYLVFFTAYLNLIPFLGIFLSMFFGLAASIYKIILTIIGIRELHKLSPGKAAAVVLIPVAIVIVLLIIFFIIAFLLLGASLSSALNISPSSW